MLAEISLVGGFINASKGYRMYHLAFPRTDVGRKVPIEQKFAIIGFGKGLVLTGF
jgi:hypothetical protein